MLEDTIKIQKAEKASQELVIKETRGQLAALLSTGMTKQKHEEWIAMEKTLADAQEQIKLLKSQNKVSVHKIFDLQERINELNAKL